MYRPAVSRAHVLNNIIHARLNSISIFPQVTHNDTMEHLDDNVDKHIDTYTKTNYAQFKHVAEILNAR
jgi:hypothetical protein